MYNIFKDARLIQNSDYCRFDSLDGYSTDFKLNGDVDGWDVYYNVYLYGSWKGVLFGNLKDKEWQLTNEENVYYILSGYAFATYKAIKAG